MSNIPSVSASRAFTNTLLTGLIAVALWRFLLIMPRWMSRLAPAYPMQYQSRVLNTLISVGLLSAALVGRSRARETRGGRIAYWGLCAVSVVSLITLVIRDP